MDTNLNSHITRAVDQLFAALNAKTGECCDNPFTGGGFVMGLDRISIQKKQAAIALQAREWFAKNGPAGAPPLPLSHGDMEDYRNAKGLTCVVGFYARSLSRQGYGRKRWDVFNHPSFEDFARGLMAKAIESGIRGLAKDEALKKRFPPRPLTGMTGSGFWTTADEYEELQSQEAEHRRRVARTAVN
jgi:hypothetical protein